MAARCCGGSRVEGGVYFECGLSSSGRPLEDFILCPPVIVPDEMGISPLGVTLFEQPGRPGVWHIADWVGSIHYPNVWDFLEEVRALGLSRRLRSNLDFGKLSKESRILLCHHKAHISNFLDWPSWNCPKEINGHDKPDSLIGASYTSDTVLELAAAGLSCAGVWAEDTDEGTEPTPAERIALWGTDITGPWRKGCPVDSPRLVKRELPSLTYYAMKRPADVKPIYKPAFFASFPASRLVVIAGEGSAETLEKMKAARLLVEEVEE